MASKIADIADAVKTALTAARVATTLSLDFNITRKYVPAEFLDKLTTLTLTVTPIEAEINQITRGDMIREQAIGILIQKKLAVTSDAESTVAGVNTATNAEIDALTQFAEEVSEMWQPALLGTTGASWSRTQHKSVYDVQKLREDKIFESIVIIYFKYKR